MAKAAKKSAGKSTQKPDDKSSPSLKVISDNRKARFNYHLLDIYQAGIELTGTEVKSMRIGKANLQDSYARIEFGQLWLYNCHIAPYNFGNRFNHEPLRKRRLLMHKSEIRKLKARMQEKGLTLVPLKIYFKRNWVKVDLALAKGKQLYDKREAISKRESKLKLDKLAKYSKRGA